MEAKYKVSFEIAVDHGSVQYTDEDIEDAIKGAISCLTSFIRLNSVDTIKGIKLSRKNANDITK